jgi:hypothetical protein
MMNHLSAFRRVEDDSVLRVQFSGENPAEFLRE